VNCSEGGIITIHGGVSDIAFGSMATNTSHGPVVVSIHSHKDAMGDRRSSHGTECLTKEGEVSLVALARPSGSG
jgi:hypothetical protein